MEDETATGFEDVTPAPEGQAETTTQEPADTQTEAQPDQTEVETTTLDNDDLAWAKKKGVNLEDKAAVAKMLRNSDRKVSEAGKAKTTLQQTVDRTNDDEVDDNVVAELRKNYRTLETKFAATQYYLDNPDDKQYDAEASAILNETLIEDPEFARALGRNLPNLFALAKARHAEETVAKAKDEGRKEERSSIARKQRASATSPAATTQDIPEDDPMMKGFMNG